MSNGASLITSPLFFETDSNNNPLAGGHVYTYAAGTLIPLTTYTDATLTVPNTNPVILDTYGRAEIWLGPSIYKINVTDINGVQHPDYPIDQLQSSAGTVSTAVLAQLAAVSPVPGAALVGMQRSNTGALPFTLAAYQQSRPIDIVVDFGAPTNGTSDIGPALIKAIATTSNGQPLDIVFPPCPNGYFLATKVLFPSHVTIDFGGNTITGPNTLVSTNVGFETATWVSGVLTSNIGTPPESTLVRDSVFRNGVLANFYIGFNLQDFIWCSGIEHIEFVNCAYSVFAQRCFYSFFREINSNGNMVGNLNECYHFDGVNNSLELLGMSTSSLGSRLTAYLFNGQNPGDCNIDLRDCNAEGLGAGAIGMKFTGYIASLSIKGCYFEGSPATHIDLSSGTTKTSVDIDNNWFNGGTNAIIGANIASGRWGAHNTLFTAMNVNFSETLVNRVVVEIPPVEYLSGSYPTSNPLPSGYSIGSGCKIIYRRNLVGSGGTTLISEEMTTNPIPFQYTGSGGPPPTATVPFCLTSVTATTVTVTTRIPFANFDCLIVMLAITDTGGPYYINGMVVNGNWVNLTTVVRGTMAISNVGGFLVLTISGYTAASAVQGIVRHL